MKKTLIFLIALSAVCACAPKAEEFRILGTVTAPALEGACIYLVPRLEEVIEPTKENLDSTFITEGRFEMHGKVERLSELRIERLRRIGVQNLLVLTEPGTINVTIGPASSGGGTPLNDSLQVWKYLTEKYSRDMRLTTDKEVRDSLRVAYRNRSLRLAAACGGQIEEFITGLFPVNSRTPLQ